jgi:hypothetical protein
MAWRSRPASKLRPAQPVQPIIVSCTQLSRGSGLSCSIISAKRTAKKLIVGDDIQADNRR